MSKRKLLVATTAITMAIAACELAHEREVELVDASESAIAGVVSDLPTVGTLSYDTTIGAIDAAPTLTHTIRLDIQDAGGDVRLVTTEYDDGDELLNWPSYIDARGRQPTSEPRDNAAAPLLASVPPSEASLAVGKSWDYPLPNVHLWDPATYVYEQPRHRILAIWDFGGGVLLVRERIDSRRWATYDQRGTARHGIAAVGVVDLALGPWGAVPLREVRWYKHDTWSTSPTLSLARSQADSSVRYCLSDATGVPQLSANTVLLLQTALPTSGAAPTPIEFLDCN
jgi:hypothetical protein